MADTPRLTLPYLETSQVQKEIYHNVSMDRLDLLCQCAVLDRNLNVPPSSPALGDAYIVGGVPEDEWIGHANHLAMWVNNQWLFIVPKTGFLCWIIDEFLLVYWTGFLWGLVDLTTGGGVTTFLALLDTPDTYTGQEGKAVLVNAGGTALEFGTTGGGAPPDATYITSSSNGVLSAERVLTDTAELTWNLTTPGVITAELAANGITLGKLDTLAPGVLLGRNSDTVGNVEPITVGSGLTMFGTTLSATTPGATTFLSLTDTPDSYTGQGSKLVSVKSDATGLEFVPATGATDWTRVAGAVGSTASTGLLAFWRMEEASGNRLDSVASQAFVPTGAPGSAAGKTGQAVSFDTGSGKYLAAADSATLSVGTNQDFTVACWVRFNGTPSGSRGLVGKGNASIAYANCEYLLGTSGTSLLWYVGNGANSTNINAGVTLASGTWYLVIGWYDAAADLQYLQVNNGSPVSVANSHGSYDSTGPVEVGRQPQWTGSTPLDGLVDNVLFWKRTLTAGERTDLWNGGAGRDYVDLLPTPSYLHPATSTDVVLAGATTLTATEPLESAGGLKLGSSSSTVEGVVRWTGTDMEVRKGGVWVSMTTGAGGQPLDATLTALAGLTTGANQLPYFTGTDTAAQTPLTAAGRALLDDADATAQRTTLGLGTMATQDASAVAITGGTAVLADLDVDTNTLRIDATNHRVGIGLAAPAYPLDVTGNVRLLGLLGINAAPTAGRRINIGNNTGEYGLWIQQQAAGVGNPMIFVNSAAVGVGSITHNDTTTSYNTTSDQRLKHRIEKLVGALGIIQSLNPVRFVWTVDESQGHGFLAHELQHVLPEAVTGEPDAVNEDGSIRPQQVDHSKLVPWLVGAVQELAARVTSLETQLGL